jgi:DNA-binding PadR family transcriptional regulator
MHGWGRARYYALTAAGRRRLAQDREYWQRQSRAINLVLNRAIG